MYGRRFTLTYKFGQDLSAVWKLGNDWQWASCFGVPVYCYKLVYSALFCRVQNLIIAE